MCTLTIRDSVVLKSLFDPEATTSGKPHRVTLTTSLPGLTEEHFLSSRSIEIRIIAPLKDGAQDYQLIQQAIEKLSSLIEQSPSYASAYINRAQARRMLIPVEHLFTAEHADAMYQIFSDLQRGIQLAEPRKENDPVSDHQASVLSTAYTHRGFLLLKLADIVRSGEQVYGVDEPLRLASAENIEEQASRDFALGGKYGNNHAKEMAVKTNPYAKMCGAIVKEALRKENEEWMAGQLY